MHAAIPLAIPEAYARTAMLLTMFVGVNDEGNPATISVTQRPAGPLPVSQLAVLLPGPQYALTGRPSAGTGLCAGFSPKSQASVARHSASVPKVVKGSSH